jgi:hypothetical protein
MASILVQNHRDDLFAHRVQSRVAQQAGFEGLPAVDDLWRLRDRIIVTTLASGDFADLISEQIGTGWVRRQRLFRFGGAGNIVNQFA